MIHRIGADLVVLAHFLFILLVVFGGLLVARWPRLAWIHLPAAIWGVLVELMGWYCPLTPLENRLRRAGGEAGYEGGFIEHYLVPLIYPDGLTPRIQIVLGLAVLLINLAVYGWIICRWKRRQGANR
jgi:hypothetical protein